MTSIVANLKSALSSLQARFPDDPEKLHLAVAAVFSSIFLAHSVRVVVVGGQAATHWLRVSGSRDVDFVSSDFGSVRDTLLAAGFRATDSPFRLLHPGTTTLTSVLIELVGDVIDIAGVQGDLRAVTTIRPDDVEDAAVRRLMRGDALVIDPCSAFLNYADASSQDSIWYDHHTDGSLAYERAAALLALYRPHIAERLRALEQQGMLPSPLLERLQDFLELSSD